jgi:hypothetical protein
MFPVVGLSFRPSIPPGQFDPTRGLREAAASAIAEAGAASPRSADLEMINLNATRERRSWLEKHIPNQAI